LAKVVRNANEIMGIAAGLASGRSTVSPNPVRPNRPCWPPSSVPASVSLVSAAPTYCRSSANPLPPPYPLGDNPFGNAGVVVALSGGTEAPNQIYNWKKQLTRHPLA
jgi:hypothetical protein